MTLLVKFLYQGSVEGISDELVTLSQYARELCVEGLLNSVRGTKPVRLELIDKKEAAKLELEKLLTIDSDSNSCSSDEDDISVLYENLEKNSRRLIGHKVNNSLSTKFNSPHKKLKDLPLSGSSQKSNKLDNIPAKKSKNTKKRLLSESIPPPATPDTSKKKPALDPSGS